MSSLLALFSSFLLAIVIVWWTLYCSPAAKPGWCDSHALLHKRLPPHVATAMLSPLSRALIGLIFAQLLFVVHSFRDAANFDAVLTAIFSMVLIVIGITMWMYVLVGDAQHKAPNMPVHRRTSVTTIRRSCEHLAGLIEELLDISQIEVGQLEISRDRIHLRVFLRQVASIFQELARENNIDFALTTSGRLPNWITSDEKRLRQILINLLSNALRYTETGSVSLHLSYRNEVAVIDVTDTGIGITDAALPRIWEPFARRTHPSVAGTGLGLTITTLLVEVMGGDIEVKATPGVGSRFRVRMMLPSVPVNSVENLGRPRLRDRQYLGHGLYWRAQNHPCGR